MRRRRFLTLSAASIGGTLVYTLERKPTHVHAQESLSLLLVRIDEKNVDRAFQLRCGPMRIAFHHRCDSIDPGLLEVLTQQCFNGALRPGGAPRISSPVDVPISTTCFAPAASVSRRNLRPPVTGTSR